MLYKNDLSVEVYDMSHKFMILNKIEIRLIV